MNENENSLSERFVEHAAAAYKRMGLSDEDYWLQQLGRWMFLDRDAILVALRAAERPTPSPDATEAARAMREAAAKGREAVDRAKEALAWIATNMSGVSLFDWNEKANAILSGLNFATNPIYVLPTPQPDERDEALRVAKEAVQAKITKAQIQCDKHAPMGGIKYLSWFGRLAGLKDALASIAAAKSKGGEG